MLRKAVKNNYKKESTPEKNIKEIKSELELTPPKNAKESKENPPKNTSTSIPGT